MQMNKNGNRKQKLLLGYGEEDSLSHAIICANKELKNEINLGLTLFLTQAANHF